MDSEATCRNQQQTKAFNRPRFKEQLSQDLVEKLWGQLDLIGLDVSQLRDAESL